jgi:GGDEF domain-containing protein
LVLVSLTITIIILSLGYFTLGRVYLKKLAIDPLTGLLNEQAVLTKIRRIKSPFKYHVNALALFDISNINEINGKFGYTGG